MMQDVSSQRVQFCHDAGCIISEGTVLPAYIPEHMSFFYPITKLELQYQFVIEVW